MKVLRLFIMTVLLGATSVITVTANAAVNNFTSDLNLNSGIYSSVNTNAESENFARRNINFVNNLENNKLANENTRFLSNNENDHNVATVNNYSINMNPETNNFTRPSSNSGYNKGGNNIFANLNEPNNFLDANSINS